MPHTGPEFLSATALLAAYRAGTLSPVDTTEAVLARIDAWEPRLGAIFAQHKDRARAAALASAARWQAGGPVGALDGVPITIKDLITTQGDPTPVGTAASELTPATSDAPPAARVLEAGAVVVGKTTMPDFGMLSSGTSSYHPTGRNPWNLARTPGGSSGGAAAAAAALMGPLHIGTDIGGSVRLPAGWCGIFALKPSLGRIPIDPPYIGRVAGPMTRTVQDAALLMSVLAQPDARDHMALPPAAIDWSDLDIDLRGKRLGLMMSAGTGLAVEPEVAAAVERAAQTLAQAGAIVERVQPFLTTELLHGIDLFWRTRFLAQVQAMDGARAARMLPFIRAWVEGSRGAAGLDVYAGFDCLMRVRAAGHAALQGYDYWLSPTAPLPAFAAELPCPTNDPARPFEHIAFTVPFNMTEQPAASINCGMTEDGLPIGLQIVGHRFDDLGVLRVARAYEKLRPPQATWPAPQHGPEHGP